MLCSQDKQGGADAPDEAVDWPEDGQNDAREKTPESDAAGNGTDNEPDEEAPAPRQTRGTAKEPATAPKKQKNKGRRKQGH